MQQRPYWKSGDAVGEYVPLMRPRLVPGLVVMVVAVIATACGGSSGGSKGVSNGTAHSATAAAIEAQLSQRGITPSGAIHCNGRAPGVIDCTGKTSDGKMISATLTAATNGTSCTGPLVIHVGSNEVASVASAKCN
jgi:hypothetical protein